MFLAERRIEPEERDFFERAFRVEKPWVLLKSVEIAPRDVVSTKGPSFREMGLDLA